jgi:cytidylate kinase
MVAEKLGLRFINFTFRALAQEKNLGLNEALALAAKDDWWDREVDRRQVSLAREDGGCVVGSRLAIWMLLEADLKVYLYAGLETRARRIVKREGGAFEDAAAWTAERDRQDRERYLRLYGIDNDDYAFADLVIDVTSLTPEEIASRIVERAALSAAYSSKNSP